MVICPIYHCLIHYCSKSIGESRSGWFLAELDNAIRFAATNRVQSSLLAIKLKSTDQTQLVADFLGSNIRSLDSSWQPHSAAGSSTVVVLMPLMNDDQCKAYLQRVAKKLSDDHNIELDNVAADIQIKKIKKRDTRDTCLTFVNKVAGFTEPKIAKKTKGWRKRVA